MFAEPNVRIIESGISIPEQVMSNDHIASYLNFDIEPGWVEDRLGIRERRLVSAPTMTSDLATEAINNALERAGVQPESIDLFILATATPDVQAPATACITQYKTGMTNAVAFDVSAVCSGFLFALTTAAAFLRSGQSQRAIVVGADCFSKVTDWSRRDCIFFGDGAGAVILEASSIQPSNSAIFDAELFADGRDLNAFMIKSSKDYFEMDGKAVYQAASKAVPKCIEKVLSRNGLSSQDIDIVVPHQPSISLLKNIAKKSEICFSKFQTNMDRYANTGAATIPIMLHETVEDEKIKDGDLLLLAAAGAGFTAGAVVYRWH